MARTATKKSPIKKDVPAYDEARLAQIKSDFDRDGFVRLPGLLSAAEVKALKAGVDRVLDDPQFEDTNHRYGPWIAVRLFETDLIFEEMLDREPIIGIAEHLLGKDCHLIAQNAVRNKPGIAIDDFHVDDALMFPVAEGMDRHDPRLRMPAFLITFQMLLTDVPSAEFGPTEYIPGSHYSGRHPNDKKNPTFDGKPPVAITGKAGDVYIHNGQCWHRGAPNTSDRIRYLFQHTFGMRWVSQRFYPFVNYQFPPGVVERATERRKRVLGFHPKGPYG